MRESSVEHLLDTKGFSMLAVGSKDSVNLLGYFDDLPDPRSTVNRLHRLGDVIMIAICAVVANADGPTAIAHWARLNEAWLHKHLQLSNGVPGKDTFRRVLSMIDPAAFQQCFKEWLGSLNLADDDEPGVQPHIAIDGKTLHRSHDKKNGLGPMHIVSAWISEHGITLGQMATDEKSNQITAIPQLLEILDVEGAIVTIDAAGCQKNIAAQVIDGKGDYVLAVKGNHSKRFDDVRLALGSYLHDDGPSRLVSRHVEVEQGHGRLESRTYYQITAPGYLHGRAKWKGVKTIGATVRVYEEDGVEKSDTRYYLSSLPRNGERFANAVRNQLSLPDALNISSLTYSHARVLPPAAGLPSMASR